MASVSKSTMPVLDIIREVRDRRRTLEQQWLNHYHAWKAMRSRSFYQSKHSRYYIPAASRAIERSAVRIAQMLIPPSKLFEVHPGDIFSQADGPRADAVFAYIEYLLREKLPMYRILTQLARTMLLYGRAITKRFVQVSQDGRGNIEMVWPMLRVVDPFSHYVFPETVETLQDALLIFEDTFIPLPEYEIFVAQGLAEPLSRSEFSTPEFPSHVQQRLSFQGIPNPETVFFPLEKRSDQLGNWFVHLTEVWFREEAQWNMKWVVWNTKQGPRIVRSLENVFTAHPYRMSVHRSIPGEQYTAGSMQDIEPLQILLNDQVNQAEDARLLAAFPPIAIDPAIGRTTGLVVAPGRKWYVRPDQVSVLPYPDVSRNGAAAASVTLNLINSFGGPSPLVEGQPPRNSPRAGFALSSLINLSLADLADTARLMEWDLLSPLPGDLLELTVLHVPPQQVFQIPGTEELPIRQLSIRDLRGRWVFKWLGTLQAQDTQMRSQRLISFVESLVTLAPVLQAQGLEVDWDNLLKVIWREGLGEQSLEKLVRPASMPSGMMGGMNATLPGGSPGRSPAVPVSPEGQQRQMSRHLTQMFDGGL